ncbi:hypothetical protein ACKI2B_44810, partial [Streptomyces scabiei]
MRHTSTRHTSRTSRSRLLTGGALLAVLTAGGLGTVAANAADSPAPAAASASAVSGPAKGEL